MSVGKFKKMLNMFYIAPFIEPYWDFNEIKIIYRLIKRQEVIDGYEINSFENKLKEFLGANKVLSYNKGRSAIGTALKSLKIPKNKEVLVPSFICFSVIKPILENNLIPKFVDINDNLNMSVDSLLENISDNTKVIILPHLSGKAANIEEIEKIANDNALFLIDDAAQSFGAKYNGKYLGTFGDFGVFSFGLGKNMMATAGGSLSINNNKLKNNVKKVTLKENRRTVIYRTFYTLSQYRLRSYNIVYPVFLYYNLSYKSLQTNYIIKRMSNMDSALCISQMEKLQSIIHRRKRNAAVLTDLLSNVENLELPDSKDHIFTKYIIKFEEKVSLSSTYKTKKAIEANKYLRKHGIEPEWSYTPIHIRRPEFLKYQKCDLKKTNELWQKLLTLPVQPHLDSEKMHFIADTLKGFLKAHK